MLDPLLPLDLGRYVLYREIAHGGMATIYLGQLTGAVGFSRTVAIKRMHPHLARDPAFVNMFADEARLAARVNHPNVVPTIDIVALEGELFLVMEHVRGETVGRLIRAAKDTIPVPVVCALLRDTLLGLHAAHEALGEDRQPMNLIHRDVSPQNILVGKDGIARIFDFGVARASGRLQHTEQGVLKGKLPYMAPEMLAGQVPTRQIDIYAAAVVLWEALTGRKLVSGETEAAMLHQIVAGTFVAPSVYRAGIPGALDEVVRRGLSRSLDTRYPTAQVMAADLERALAPAGTSAVADWMEQVASESLARTDQIIHEIESSASDSRRFQALLANAPRSSTSVLEPGTDQSLAFRPLAATQPPRAPSSLWLGLGAAGAVLSLGAVGLAIALTRVETSTAAARTPSLRSEEVFTCDDAVVALASTAGGSSSNAASESKPPLKSGGPKSGESMQVQPPKRSDCTPPYEWVEGKKKYKSHCL
jgi:eukaryotic-like serine/threonine-protein kinase